MKPIDVVADVLDTFRPVRTRTEQLAIAAAILSALSAAEKRERGE